jgi:hypothetical protein
MSGGVVEIKKMVGIIYFIYQEINTYICTKRTIHKNYEINNKKLTDFLVNT